MMFFFMPAAQKTAFADELESAEIESALSIQGDTIVTATPIQLNKATTGTLTFSAGTAWYKITLPSAGRFDIMFGGDHKTTGSWGIALYDASKNSLWSGTRSADNTVDSTVCTTGLPAGTYYIRVVSSGANDLSYRLTPKFAASSSWEAEDNNTIVAANAISCNKETNGCLQNSSDVDWYKITLSSAGKLELVLNGDYRDSESYALALHDASNKAIWSEHCQMNNTKAITACTIGLPKGTYYIKVASTYSNKDNYSYTVTPKFSASSEWEAELNDTIATANNTALGKRTYGNLQSSSESDWFKIDLTKPGTFAVSFLSEYKESGSLYVRLYDATNSVLKSELFKTNKTVPSLVCTKELDAGTYFIQVQAFFSVQNLSYELTPYYLVTKPEATSSLEYNGKEQSGAQNQDGITLSGTTNATNEGAYTAVATLDDGYIWSDGDSNDLILNWAIEQAGRIAMHRLYNPYSGEHFYTADESERDEVAAAGWEYEGVGWTAPNAGDPVYRVYNPYAGDHHYTLDVEERDGLVAAGWTDEGVGWRSDPGKAVPLYREYNPNMFSCNHNYTADRAEHDSLVSIGWADEGEAWYGVM